MVLDKGAQECWRMNRTHTQASTQHNTGLLQMLALEPVRQAPGPCLPSLPLKSRKLAVTVVIIGRRNGQGSLDSAQGGAAWERVSPELEARGRGEHTEPLTVAARQVRRLGRRVPALLPHQPPFTVWHVLPCALG